MIYFVVKSINAPCNEDTNVSTFQPERIDPPDPRRPDYDIRADVWSLGLSLVCFLKFSFFKGII